MSKIPSPTLIDSVKSLVLAHGDRAISARCGVSRTTVCRIAAGLPVLESVLFCVEARIGGAEKKTDEAA
jgi:hypothetical protein